MIRGKKRIILNNMNIFCNYCNKEFHISPSRIGRKKYCSQPCYWKSVKERKGEWGNPVLIAKRAERVIKNGLSTRFKVGHSSTTPTGINSPAWKGDFVGYVALHDWVRKTLGKPTTCEYCKRTNLEGQKIHWANKSQKYKRDVEDWLRLCAKCHSRYDRSMKLAWKEDQIR